MHKLLLVAGLAAAALIPSFAFAQTSCEQQHNSQVATTIAGAGIGALVGATVAPRRDRGEGALIGAGAGAVLANQASQPERDCSYAYGYYDHDNQWHASNTDRANARGYYDRDGAWVDGAPNGRYDARGVWISGAPGADVLGANASFQGNGYRGDGDGHRDIDSREDWLQQRIDFAAGDGSLSRYQARSDRNQLASIRRDEAYMRQEDGELSPRQDSRLQARLDTLTASVRQSVHGDGF